MTKKTISGKPENHHSPVKYRTVCAIAALVLLLDAIGVSYGFLTINNSHWNELVTIFFTYPVTIFLLQILPKFGLYQGEASRKLLVRTKKLCHTLSFLSMFSISIAVLSYLAVMVDLPLIDPALSRADAFFGFYWPSIFNTINNNRIIASVLYIAYQSIFAQALLAILFIIFFEQKTDIIDFIFIFVVSAFIVLVFSVLFPAEGAFYYYHKVDAPGAFMVSDLPLLRAGLLKNIDIFHLQGLISFPSFHACMAIMFSYALRRNVVIFSFSIPLNILVFISAIYWGGHYLSDLLAAASLMLFLIVSNKFFHAETRSDFKLAPEQCTEKRYAPAPQPEPP
jgi:membrane-associated phospholipid phosphatase